MTVGVVALQGDVEAHVAAFARLGVEAKRVRRPAELGGLTHLVLPGGESTALAHLLRLFGLWDAIVARHAAGDLALFGTCAGAILLGRGADGEERPPRLGLLDAVVHRNAYGTQLDSFEEPVEVEGVAGDPLPAVFIRAPRFGRLGDSVSVLARRGSEPILVAGDGVLAATFHPELTGEDRLHAWFLSHTCSKASLTPSES